MSEPAPASAEVTRAVAVGEGASRVTLGGGAPLVLIAGPCLVEGRDFTVELAATIARLCAERGVPYVFKASFDKANRSSARSNRGPGVDEGLGVLAAVKAELGVPATTDVHLPEQARAAAEVVDLLQIPAFLCRQTDLLEAAAATGRPVNVKKGQFLAPEDMAQVAAKLEGAGAHGVVLTERGTTFGYHRLVNDLRALPIMRATGWPVVFDATHSVQLPGAQGTSSGGDRRWVEPLARAAVAVGVDALFLEVHPNPERAPSDGPNAVRLSDLAGLLDRLLVLDRAARSVPTADVVR